MPRDHLHAPEPAPPGAAAELSAALTAMDFGLGTLFTVPGNIMADPETLAAAAIVTRPRRTTKVPPVAEPTGPSEVVRHRVDLLNRQFCRVSHGLAMIDAALARAISDHLEEIGLDPQ